MPQRNRERIMQQSLYDLLCKINDNMFNGAICIVWAIDGKKPKECKGETCGKCIQKWLNEEFPF